MKFLGLQPGDRIPERNTIWDFRESLERNGRNGSQRLFKRFDKLLQDESIIGHEGSIVDAKIKLITNYTSTSASVHDSQVFEDLVDKTDNAIFADSAYFSEETESFILEQCDAQDFVMFKAKKKHPLTDKEKATNKLRSRIRVRVEHVYGCMKQMGMDWIRNIGIKRARQHNGLSCLVYNLDRYAFLCTSS